MAKKGEAQQSIQSEQQADSARYLNELNTVSSTQFLLFFVVL